MDTRFGDEHSDLDLARIAADQAGRQTGRLAASALLGRHQDRVYAWCFRYVRDHERALDLAQDVLMLAFRDLGAFRGQARFSTWLYTVTRNRCLQEMRKPRLLVDDEADPDTQSAKAAPPDRAFEEKLAEEQVLNLIRDHLTPQEQDALWLRCFDRLPVDTVTEILRITETTGARAVLQRARRKLRAALGRQGDEP